MISGASAVAFTIFISMFALIAAKLLIQGMQNRALKVQVIRLTQELEILKNLLSKQEAIANGANNGFIKFISDSRDKAFEYIEEVQTGLNKFVAEVDPLINYFDEYGDTMGMLPNYEGMKHISAAFKELKQLLPEDEA
jgi:hypothetical protein